MNSLSLPTIIVISAMACALVLIPQTWKWIMTHFVTLAHESGHAIMGILTFGRVGHIKINFDRSGETVTSRGSRILPIGACLSLLAGYPFPVLLGAFMIAASQTTWHMIAFWAVAAIGVMCAVFIRNFFGFLIVAIWAAFFAHLAINNPPYAMTAFVAAAIFLIIGGVRDLFGLIRMYFRKQTGETDLGILKGHTHIPEGIWLIMITGISAVTPFFIYTSLSILN
jgi:hypothetical protein